MLAIETDEAVVATGVLGSWACCSHAPGAISDPEQLDAMTSQWLDATVPGTVASALAAAGQWDMQHPPQIDTLDWWYRTWFAGPGEFGSVNPCWLKFDGLATLAEIWLNGERLLTTDNMFRSYRLDVSSLLRANNELVIGFRSVTANLQSRRPRPRWKTNLVQQQQLRWQRTTLLGRIAGWSPPVPAIGPWGAIQLDQASVSLSDVRLVTHSRGNDRYRLPASEIALGNIR